MIKILEKLLNLIYIQPCYFCKSTKEDKIICKKCYSKIHFMPVGVFREEKGCRIYACCLYDNIIKRLIKDLKYNKKKKLAKLQADLMYEYWKEIKLKDSYIILPVPIHEKRREIRKYNHMDIVADELSKLTKFTNNKKFLIRIKDTERQYNLNKQQRTINLKDAFAINDEEKIDKTQKLLIIDDITSTGTTIKEIIKVLRKNGYKDITAITLATPDIWN